ncbi:MAG: hypothetical protein GXO43_01485 [Crenarchaeota archaeon]|nr:hypothetical protein [Thermoproteota archaeon]
MTYAQETLFRWLVGLGKPRNNWPNRDDYVPVYLVLYNIPSEEGKFYVERRLDNGQKIKIKIVPDVIINKLKNLRFKFYKILCKHHVVETRLGRIVDRDEIPSLQKELDKWTSEFIQIQVLLDDFLAMPWIYKEWEEIQKNISLYKIEWPPKDLNIIRDFYLRIEGPIFLPKKLYDSLILRAKSKQ